MYTALVDMQAWKTAQTVIRLRKSMNMIVFMMVLFYSFVIDARINIIYDKSS